MVVEVQVEERERVWNDLDMVADRVGIVYRLYVLRDLNGSIGDRLKGSISGGFGVPRDNGMGRRVRDFYAEGDYV